MKLKKLFSFFNLPSVKLITGIVLLVSGVLELSDSALEKLFGIDLRIHHGIIIFAITKVLGSVAEILEGSEKVSNARKEKKAIHK